MKGLGFFFVASAAVYLTLGMLWGISMGIAHDFQMAPAHAHLNLVGGVLMAIFGLFYHVVPRAGATALARVHFWVATLGVWIFPAGIALSEATGRPAMAIVGSLVVLASMLIFLGVVMRSRL
ncbi:heme-copper oxidase family protein [Acidimangrovimonas sediminis]|uniref:hypothetical protein n=1 Tax=Acidimangrovimonas sediminis TaxID=2056283 RepID=UPI0018EC86FD|nr:hypothetical protein [Acidimangrovimonas sediminis]